MSGTWWVETLTAVEKGPARNSVRHTDQPVKFKAEPELANWSTPTVDLPIPTLHSPTPPKHHNLCDDPDSKP